MELRQIEYFLAVVRYGGYTHAASALYVSQPSLSIAIQKLENELGVKLLERDNKRIALTKEGEIFHRQAEKLLRDADEILCAMRDLNPALKKRIRIAFPSNIGSWLWQKLFCVFPESHANIQLEVQDLGTRDIVKLLKSIELEIGYGVIDLIEDADIEFERIKKGELKLILPAKHPLAAREKIALTDLRAERLIMYHRNTTFTEQLFLGEMEQAGLRARPFYVREQSSVFDIVAQGFGVAPVLNDKLSAIQDNPRICSRPFERPIFFQAGLLWNKNVFLSESARAFQNFIRQFKD